MSAVLGIDISTRAVDLVKLDETTNAATWRRVTLDGKTAFERLRTIRPAWWFDGLLDDVYLAAIEAPMSRGQPGTLAKLSRVFGAVVACLPARLELWEVAPVQWRKELGLPGNASKDQCADAVGKLYVDAYWDEYWPQDALDAYAVAYYARQVNARGLVAP